MSDTATATPPAQKPAATAAKPYVMPHAYTGMNVLWYHGGARGHAPFAGLVTDVGDRTVNVVVFDNTGRMNCLIGCRHMDDPGAVQHDRVNSGGWDYTEGSKP